MKILIIHTFYRFKGGEDAQVEAEIALLNAAGFEVDLLEFCNPTNSLLAMAYLLMLSFNVFSYFKTRKKLRSFKPDVVHLHNWHFAASPAVISACHHTKVPIVLSLHNFRLICPSATLFHHGEIFLESLHQKFPWKAIQLGVYRGSTVQTFLLAFAVFVHKQLKTWQKVSKYIVFSEPMKSVFLESSLGLAADKFVIKPNSIPDSSVTEMVKRGDHFLFIGRLVEEKGIEVILAAFAETNLSLHIYGYGPLESKVKAEAAKYPNIQFFGALPSNEVLQSMRNCSALIFPSIWYEGMPVTLIESFSTGTPVIASKLGAMSTMVLDHFNGIHFEAGNKDDLIEKLVYWDALPKEEKEEYYLRARAKYEKRYTTQDNLVALESIYLDVINQLK